ncbi:MAG TPA: Holliday junction branch migration protein RuvA, partial [Verrucomicrobiae bacterium]|nr:Holliday junction branch migration protein RuvA [Verrucomicrobiae bacterium]
ISLCFPVYRTGVRPDAVDCDAEFQPMITFLHGKLVDALPTQVTVDVNGVGYEALIPLSSYDKLPSPGQEVKLLTHLAVREDAHVLYGFMTTAERELFRLLINTVSGIGPKIALNILSGIMRGPFAARWRMATSRRFRKSPGSAKKPPNASSWS